MQPFSQVKLITLCACLILGACSLAGTSVVDDQSCTEGWCNSVALAADSVLQENPGTAYSMKRIVRVGLPVEPKTVFYTPTSLIVDVDGYRKLVAVFNSREDLLGLTDDQISFNRVLESYYLEPWPAQFLDKYSLDWLAAIRVFKRQMPLHFVDAPSYFRRGDLLVIFGRKPDLSMYRILIGNQGVANQGVTIELVNFSDQDVKEFLSRLVSD